MRKWIPAALFTLFLIPTALSPAAMADDDNDRDDRDISVTRGEVQDDLFTAGGTVDVDAQVAGDVFAAGASLEIAGQFDDALVAAGGRIGVDAEVAGDALVAGGTISIRGSVGDNLVAAGGDVSVDSTVGGKAIASGGSVRLGRGAIVGGDAWLAGGQVTLSGSVAGDARIKAGNTLILGNVTGDVDVTGEELEVGPGAHIVGALTFRGPEAPKIDSTAKIEGGVNHIAREGMRDFGEKAWPALFFATMLPSLFLFVLAVTAVWAAPGFVARAGGKLGSQPLASLGLGVLGFAATPAVLLVLLITVIGIPFAFALAGLYVFALFFGVPVAVLAVIHVWAESRSWAQPSRGKLIGFAALAFIALWAIGLIPFIGGLVWMGATCFGIGAALLVLNAVMKGRAAA